jgi:hypothetical protein
MVVVVYAQAYTLEHHSLLPSTDARRFIVSMLILRASHLTLTERRRRGATSLQIAFKKTCMSTSLVTNSHPELRTFFYFSDCAKPREDVNDEERLSLPIVSARAIDSSEL